MRAKLVLALLFLPSFGAHAIPGDVLYSEDFESGLGGWSQTVGPAGSFGRNTAFTDWDAFVAGDSEVRAVSPTIDLSAVNGVRLSLTITRGKQIRAGDGTILSNKPETDENFTLEYVDNNGNWIAVLTEFGGGNAGEVFLRTVDLGAGALHAGFQLRASTVGGDPWDGEADDFWHYDDIQLIETSSAGSDLSDCAMGDDFESGLGNWNISGNAAAVATTYNSASYSLDMVGQSTATQANPLDLNGKQATLTAWVRAGGWSGGPDGPSGSSEMLRFDYQRSNGSWVTLYEICNCQGSGDLHVDSGGVAIISVVLPNAARHAAARLRIHNPSNAPTADHWYVDDFCISATSPVDHFAVVHDGSAVNCQAEYVQIEAHAVDHSVSTDYQDAVALSTSTNHGDWSKAVAAGTLVNNGNGSGTYSFIAADKGVALLRLANTYSETLNINVLDNPFSEHVNEDADLVYSSSGFQFVSAGSGTPVGAQIAGKPSSTAPANAIELQAIRTSDSTGACEAAFVNSVSVEVAASCEDPAACAGKTAVINGSPIATANSGSPAAWTSLAFDFGNNTDSTAPIDLQYSDAGSLKLHARKSLSPSGEIMSGTSGAIVFRPFGFDMLIDEGSITTTNPAATSEPGTAFERAGDAFRATIRAVAWDSADDVDGDGFPDGHGDTDATNNASLADNAALPNFGQEISAERVNLQATLFAPAGGNNVPLSGSTTLGSFSNGVASANDLRWSEVGVLELVGDIADDDYLGSGNVTSRSGAVGRFVAHHLDTAVVHHGCSDISAFGWSGQPVGELQVRAFAANGAVAQNYSWNSSAMSGFARDITLSDPAASPPGSFSGIVSRSNFRKGMATVNNAPAYTFGNRETGRYALVLRATDTDSASSSGYAEGTTEIRSGQLRLLDTRAPALRTARATMFVEEWNGSDWEVSGDDTCTASLLAVENVSLSDYTGNLDPGESVAKSVLLQEGQGTLTFSAPGTDGSNANDGTMQATFDIPGWLEISGDPVITVEFRDIQPTEDGFIYREEIIKEN